MYRHQSWFRSVSMFLFSLNLHFIVLYIEPSTPKEMTLNKLMTALVWVVAGRHNVALRKGHFYFNILLADYIEAVLKAQIHRIQTKEFETPSTIQSVMMSQSVCFVYEVARTDADLLCYLDTLHCIITHCHMSRQFPKGLAQLFNFFLDLSSYPLMRTRNRILVLMYIR